MLNGVILFLDTYYEFGQIDKTYSKKSQKGISGISSNFTSLFCESISCATEVVIGFISEEGAAVQEQQFSCKDDARKDETIQTTILKVIERADAKTVLEVAGVSLIK